MPVKVYGRIEIGLDALIPSFVRAYDLGGTAYEGKDSYPSMEAALQDLEAGIKASMEEVGLDRLNACAIAVGSIAYNKISTDP